MHVSLLIAEIGSTTTVVNAFDIVGKSAGNNSGKNAYGPGGASGYSGPPYSRFIGQGQAATTVLQGDVTAGLRAAVGNLKTKLQTTEVTWDEMYATSSAAGGLRMSVHGLVYNMTVRAAREAALGAGAIVKLVTAGKLRKSDLKKIRELNPNIILIAGGVDYGERITALHNFKMIADLGISVPVIYAGNIENHDEVNDIAAEKGIRLYITENVYPGVDTLNVEPARKIIQQVFEEHIVHAPGMSRVREMVDGPIIPTPGAVMEAAKLLRENIGDLLVFDVGGATTDVHSVTDGSEEIAGITVNPEPSAKRTVEGDLGVYVNLRHIVDRIGKEKLKEEFGETEILTENTGPIPVNRRQEEFIQRLTAEAVMTSLERHAGAVRDIFSTAGKIKVAEGKDLTAVKFIIGTGGALTRLPGGEDILRKIGNCPRGGKLYPGSDAEILLDNHYIMASLGILSKRHPEAALELLKNSLGL